MPRKSVQRKLPFPEPPGLTNLPEREEPTIWVRRLLLWHDVAAEPIRNVPLKRGLNIVWSPTGGDLEALSAGHAAGKTLFCRLLRYCLGEDSFADPEDTSAIRASFPNGGVGAEIRLRGETWLVRRRFGAPRDDRAMKAERIEQLVNDCLPGSFNTFRNEIEGAFFGEDQRRLLAEITDDQGAWQYVLAWLTRDQECRLDGLTHWRHQESSSQSPARTAGAETRLNVLRVALGLYSEDSRAARYEIALASREAEVKRAAARRAESRFNLLRDDLQFALNIESDRIWPPPVELLQDDETARDKHFQFLMTLADDRIRSTGAISRDPALARDEMQLEQASGELAKKVQRIANLEDEIDRQKEHAKLLERERADRWAEVREAKYPVCPYDGTPLDVDEARFVCPLPRLPDPVPAERSAAEAAAAREEVLTELRANEGVLTALKGEKGALEEKVKALRRRLEASQHAAAATTKASQEAWATKGRVRQLVEVQEQSAQALRAEEEAVAALRGLQARQIAGLAAFSTSKLQRWFDFLVRRVVTPEATGTIVLDGNGLQPRINWHGIRRSVALNSLQIVLFDLAAMLCAVEGNSLAPAFLVHDSPREGDLDPWTYTRLFEAIFELGPDEATAPFQYIVTTTSDPPPGVRSRIRLQISAHDEQQRLFQVDL